jgi:hypothetical protein
MTKWPRPPVKEGGATGRSRESSSGFEGRREGAGRIVFVFGWSGCTAAHQSVRIPRWRLQLVAVRAVLPVLALLASRASFTLFALLARRSGWAGLALRTRRTRRAGRALSARLTRRASLPVRSVLAVAAVAPW